MLRSDMVEEHNSKDFQDWSRTKKSKKTGNSEQEITNDMNFDDTPLHKQCLSM